MGHLPFWKPAFVLYYVYTDILLLVYSKKFFLVVHVMAHVIQC